MLFGRSSIISTWVIPALYPEKSCIFGSSPSIRHDRIRAIGFFAFFLGLNASDPLLGLCIVGIFQILFPEASSYTVLMLTFKRGFPGLPWCTVAGAWLWKNHKSGWHPQLISPMS